MTSEAQSDIALIERTIQQQLEAPEPAPRQRVRPTVRKAEPIAPIGDDDGDDSDAFADDGADIVIAPRTVAATVGLSVPGLPSIEEIEGVIQARAGVVRLAEQRASVAAEITAAEAELGLKAGASARDIERLAVQLLAAGKPDDAITNLEALRVKLRRLTGAEELANKALIDARERARRELSSRAADAEFRPAARASALALLELMRCKAAEQDAINRLRAAGFAQPGGTFTSELLDPWHNTVVLHLVRDGWLTREEVRASCPFMSGV
ncbi:hypothetical protein J8F10_30435 [Gemmata sp. G18]|uniref:Uncharacterized protein n=1 Tax=Gemmata palustris TaxID=2822762 RepID=A0ABS5C0U7_9BACT|nr:hypothetical protein [Gemmata palustris]MBP3959584.1 hypothetical protein [Gemmata palustris]